MNRYRTVGILLRRVNYGEHDRIITFLTTDHGKVSAIARGVRKPKSKLAGGMELFSISELSFLAGKGDLEQLVSTRMVTHFGEILKDYDRLQLGYKAIELVEKLTEQDSGREYYDLLQASFEQLNDHSLSLAVIELWFRLRLLSMLGHQPNVLQGQSGEQLRADERYEFDHAEGTFVPSVRGVLTADHIKSWRLLLLKHPHQLKHIRGLAGAAADSLDAVRRLYGQLFQLV